MKKALNLYCGVGGNRKNWPGNIEVMAVENDPKIAALYQRLNPKDIVIVTDAHQYLLEHYEENIYYGNNHCPAQILRNCVHPNVGREIFTAALQKAQSGKGEV